MFVKKCLMDRLPSFFVLLFGGEFIGVFNPILMMADACVHRLTRASDLLIAAQVVPLVLTPRSRRFVASLDVAFSTRLKKHIESNRKEKPKASYALIQRVSLNFCL